MKTIDLIIMILLLIIVGSLWGFIIEQYNNPKVPKDSSKPKLVMDSVCATPNGHPIYKYQDGKNTIYVIVSHSHGYPISMTVE